MVVIEECRGVEVVARCRCAGVYECLCYRMVQKSVWVVSGRGGCVSCGGRSRAYALECGGGNGVGVEIARDSEAAVCE